MKLLSTALLAAGLVALSACGGEAEENVAANTAVDDLYNVTEEPLTLDNGVGNDLGNDLGNVTGNDSDVGNVTDTNTTGNSQ